MSKPRIHVITLAEIVPQHESEVIQVLRTAAVLTRQEDGCLRYDLYRDTTNPMRINTIEVWADEASLNRHMNAPHVKQAIMTLIGKLAGIPQFRVLQVVDEFEI
ncbi:MULTISPECIES: putative quinol monooxygenase [Niveibacterium]|uniref:Antibiotic biosynthesis monooxygenase n=1 Tax=Niveibacterium microcysteis TaxID=2811415 RepID=A0ABX7MB00_9RHOO|nr:MULTISPECIES: putative quinol monooxygenase [Niveibacterium]QSI78897.1 antibiotic biosynthesis monooxygenase [Niveibacterium microcysteis]